MSDLLDSATSGIQTSELAFCRFVTANDTGSNGAHQAGFYVPKCAKELLFATPEKRGENKDKNVKIKWQDSFEADSRFIYYGKAKNEYRITRFGKGFPFFTEDNVGDLLVIAKHSEEDYSGFVLSSDEDIEGFLSYFNLSPDSTNQLININRTTTAENRLQALFNKFVEQQNDFPETRIMADGARNCYNGANSISADFIKEHPDNTLLGWVDAEYQLFQSMENKMYASRLKTPFPDLHSFKPRQTRF